MFARKLVNKKRDCHRGKCFKSQANFIVGFFIYFFATLLIYINFLFISCKWRKFYDNWTKLNCEYKKLFIIDMNQRRKNMKIFKWFYGFLVASLLSSILTITRGSTATCADAKHKTMDQQIFETAYSDQFRAIPYHISLGIYFLLSDFYCTIAWCFNDMFIVCIAIMLQSDFQLLNERISLNLSVNSFFSFWPTRIIINFNFHCRTNRQHSGMSILWCTKNFVVMWKQQTNFWAAPFCSHSDSTCISSALICC